MKSKLQQLREAIIKEIPEIVELKMGCEIIKNKKKSKVYYCSENWVYYINLDNLHCQYSVGKTLLVETFKIIGRKITLADVLRVLEKKTKGKVRLEFFLDDTKIVCYKGSEHIEGNEYEEFFTWVLSKTLSNQLKPTIDFLSKIILKGDE